MPLRDHFHRPNRFVTWYSVQGMWACVMLQHLNRVLPKEYRGYPARVRGEFADPPTEDEFTLRLLTGEPDDERLVAAVEFVSPRNKDRPESRRMFVAKCAGLLQHGVCVSLVDIVTQHQFNLHADLFDFLGLADESLGTPAHPIYAVTIRRRGEPSRRRLEAWTHRLQVGQALPTLPLWLADDVCVPLELEPTYVETCETLRLPE